MIKRLAAASLIAAAMVSAPAYADTIYLVCLGAGSANKPTSSTAHAYGSDGSSAWGQIIGSRSVPFEDQVNVEVNGAASRIRLPRTMLPPIHGGNGGWFELKRVAESDSEITGSAAVNFMNSPKVVIDRRTGRISISGMAGQYSGECESYDPRDIQKKF